MAKTNVLPTPQRLQVKVFTDRGKADISSLISVFHTWIQNELIDELAIDVADYSHVPDGPGIILIGHEADYACDEIDGLGLRYVRKKSLAPTLAASVYQALFQIIRACQRLEQEAGLDIQFNLSSFYISLLDRRLYPNTEEVYIAVTETIHTVLQSVFQTTKITSEPEHTDSRYPLTIKSTTTAKVSYESLLAILSTFNNSIHEEVTN